MSRFLLVSSTQKATQEEKKEPVKALEGRFISGRNVIKTGKSAMVPKAIPIFPKIPVTLRFKTTAAVAGTTGAITLDDILGAIGVTGRVANTSVTCLATSFRVKCVRIYIGPSSTGTVDASVTWGTAGTTAEPDYLEVDAGAVNYQGQTQCLSSFPPKNSTAGYWFRDTVTGTLVVFVITCSTTGSVVEVDLEFTLPTATQSSNSITVTTAAVGNFYRLGLNKTNASANLMTPIGYPTTT